MRTPASAWQPSPRSYHPDPPPWKYPQDAGVLKVDYQGTVDLHGHRWRIGKTLAGERVMIQPIEERFIVFFCSTLVREIDPSTCTSSRAGAITSSRRYDRWQIEGWFKEMNKSPKTKSHIRGVMHVIFECAAHWKLFNERRNPIGMVRVKDSTKRRPLGYERPN